MKRSPRLTAAPRLTATALVVSLALGGGAWARVPSPPKAQKGAGVAKKRPGAPDLAGARAAAKGDRGAAQPARHEGEPAAKRRPGEHSASPERGAKGHGEENGRSAGSADQIPRPAPDDRDRDRIARMQDTISEILHSRTLARLHVGLRVMAARTGRLFYDRRGEALMDPASNQKVLATTAALMRLGGDWRYRTELSGVAPDDEGVVHGNVYVRGNGDPTLRSADLEKMATHLRAEGITRIEGGVVADVRLLGHDAPVDEQDEPGDTKAPLVVDRGMTVVRVRPGAAPGLPPVVMTEQRRFADDAGESLGFAVHNQATTRPSGRTHIGVRIESAGGRVVVAVTGRIAAGAAGVAFRRRVPRPALHAAAVLRAALGAAGIAVHEGASAGATPAGASVLAVHESEPLTIVLRRINKDSDNEQAERVLQTVGAEVLGAPATTEKGVTVLRNVIGSLGLRPNSYVPRNGSGLGHINRITANAMAELLRALYLDPRIGPEILQSLSVGGVDGTTRNRFKGTLASRRVRAKTGTLDGKSCLSGLVGDGDDVVVFSMLVQGFRGRGLAAVRASQVGAVNAIMRYVREGTGEHIELPPGFSEQPVGTDVETAGEESDAEGELDATEDLKLAPGEDAVDAYLRQTRVTAPGAGGAPGALAPPGGGTVPGGAGGRSGTARPPVTPPPLSPPPLPLGPAAPASRAVSVAPAPGARPPQPAVVPPRQPPAAPAPVPTVVAARPPARAAVTMPAASPAARGAGGAGGALPSTGARAAPSR